MNKFNTFAFGMAVGLMWALGAFLLALCAMYTGHAQEIVDIIGTGYLGYSATWLGAFVGLVWAFVDAFIGGFLFAWLYNQFAKAL